MPGCHERFKNTTGCHTSALGELFISRLAKKCKGVFEKSTTLSNRLRFWSWLLLPSQDRIVERASAYGSFALAGVPIFWTTPTAWGLGCIFSRTAKTHEAGVRMCAVSEKRRKLTEMMDSVPCATGARFSQARWVPLILP